MKKYFILISVTIICIVFCLGFIYKEESLQSMQQDMNVINYGVEEIPKDLRTVTNMSLRETDIICALSKGLIAKDENNKITSVLCNEILQSSDNIQYEFKIRDDIYWSDGSKITPDDIVTFFKELLKEEDESNIQAILDVYGARDFTEGKVTFMSGVAIKATEDSVIIRLNRVNQNFLDELTKPQYRLRKNIIMWGNMIRNYSKLSYSGDYKIESMSNDNIKLKKVNETKRRSDVINIIKDSSSESSMAAFEVNQRDIVINPPESEITKLYKENKLITLPTKKSTYVYINSRDGKVSLDNKRNIYKNMCEALRTYDDKEKEFELAECSYFREEKENLTKIQDRKVSINKNLEWEEPEILTILAQDSSENRNLCRKIELWFKENTKITIKYSLVKEEFKDKELRNRYDMVLINSEADFKDKYSLYYSFLDYLNENELKLLAKSEEDYWLLEEALFNNYDILPLAFYNENIGLSKEISILKVDSNGNIDFSSIN